MTPIPDGDGATRGVVGEGSVGSRWLRRWRWFRYELRCRRDGVIPDVAETVASPRRRLLELVPYAPKAVWGRDELGGGEMWNSNSVVAWLLVRTGVDVDLIHPPDGGRAPGWSGGIAIARSVNGLAAPEPAVAAAHDAATARASFTTGQASALAQPGDSAITVVLRADGQLCMEPVAAIRARPDPRADRRADRQRERRSPC
jgi:hypothetical protein